MLQTPAQSAAAGLGVNRDPIQLEAPMGARNRAKADIPVDAILPIRKEEVVTGRLFALGEGLVHELASNGDFRLIEDAGAADDFLDRGWIFAPQMRAKRVRFRGHGAIVDRHRNRFRAAGLRRLDLPAKGSGDQQLRSFIHERMALSAIRRWVEHSAPDTDAVGLPARGGATSPPVAGAHD